MMRRRLWPWSRRPPPPTYNAAARMMPATGRELSAAVHDLADAVRANAPRSNEFTIPREFIEAFRDGASWQFDIGPLLAGHTPQRPSMVLLRHGREFRIVFKRDDGSHYYYTFILREP